MRKKNVFFSFLFLNTSIEKAQVILIPPWCSSQQSMDSSLLWQPFSQHTAISAWFWSRQWRSTSMVPSFGSVTPAKRVTWLWRTYQQHDLKMLCTHRVTKYLPPPWFSSTWTLRRWTPAPGWTSGHTASVCYPVCAPVSHTQCTTVWRAGAQLSCWSSSGKTLKLTSPFYFHPFKCARASKVHCWSFLCKCLAFFESSLCAFNTGCRRSQCGNLGYCDGLWMAIFS